MESIDALAMAVNEFEGGLVLVSHDMRLISQVAKEIWICDHKTITMYKGDINNFKMDMRAQLHLDDDKNKAGSKGKLRGDASVMKKTENDQSKDTKKKENTKVSNGMKSTGSNFAAESVFAPKRRESSESKEDVFSVDDVKASLPSIEPPNEDAPIRPKYIPPHVRNKN